MLFDIEIFNVQYLLLSHKNYSVITACGWQMQNTFLLITLMSLNGYNTAVMLTLNRKLSKLRYEALVMIQTDRSMWFNELLFNITCLKLLRSITLFQINV